MVTFLLALITLFLISNIYVKGLNFGFDPQSVFITLLGDQDNFIEPYALESLLEMTHIDLFFHSMLFLIVAALGLRVDKHSTAMKVILAVLLLLIVIAVISPFAALSGIYFYALAWYYSFILMHMTLFLIMLLIVVKMWSYHD